MLIRCSLIVLLLLLCRFALAREVGVHGLGDVLGVFDDFDDVGRAEDDVAAGEDAFARRGAVLVDFDEAAIVDLEARRRADNLSFGAWLTAMIVLSAG